MWRSSLLAWSTIQEVMMFGLLLSEKMVLTKEMPRGFAIDVVWWESMGDVAQVALTPMATGVYEIKRFRLPKRFCVTRSRRS